MTGQMQNFASAPQAVGNRKYRAQEDAPMNNIMYDRRVVRGSNYVSGGQPQPDPADVRKQREAQRRRLMAANKTAKRSGTPEPVRGRKHMDVQTDSYLEEMTERTVEFEAETQTDFLLDRPPSPLFMPTKIGVDVETQIQEGDLFDFDFEVEPILEVLVGKTLHQSMMEVLEEEELESLRQHQEAFRMRRQKESLESQRMEAAEQRRQEEVERRIQQQNAQQERDLSIMKKVVARGVAAAHLSSVKDRVLSQLQDSGVFADSTQMAIDNVFLPNLFKAVSKEVNQAVRDQKMIEDVLKSTMSKSIATHESRLDAERRRLAALDQAEREAREELRAAKQKKQEDADMLKAHQEELLAWESFVPEPPEVIQVHVKEADEELRAWYGDNASVGLTPEQEQEYRSMFGGLEEGQIVIGSLTRPDPETEWVLQGLQVGTESDLVQADADGGDGEEGAAAAEGEAGAN